MRCDRCFTELETGYGLAGGGGIGPYTYCPKCYGTFIKVRDPEYDYAQAIPSNAGQVREENVDACREDKGSADVQCEPSQGSETSTE